MDEYSSIYSQPKTPRLKQEGFPDSIGDQHEKALIDENGEEDKKMASTEGTTGDSRSTPLTVSIPTFENVQALPTPMTYTPLSPGNLSMSPIDQSSLNIPKRRSHARLLDDMLSVTQPNQRVVSELIAPANLSPQRVVSLPTVTEEALVNDSVDSDNYTKEPYFPESSSSTEKCDDDIFQGFLLDHWDRPLLWKKVRPIGSGNFSTVLLYELMDQSNPKLKQVAVKRLKYPEELSNVEQINTSLRYKETLSRLENSLTRELQVLKSLNHPCIVKLLGINNPIFVTSKKPLRDLIKKTPRALPPCDMIMSYCPAGDLLAAVMARNGRLEAWLIQRIFTEVVLAVKYLHENSIIHRDLKLENILLKYSFLSIIGNMVDTVTGRLHLLPAHSRHLKAAPGCLHTFASFKTVWQISEVLLLCRDRENNDIAIDLHKSFRRFELFRVFLDQFRGQGRKIFLTKSNHQESPCYDIINFSIFIP